MLQPSGWKMYAIQTRGRLLKFHALPSLIQEYFLNPEKCTMGLHLRLGIFHEHNPSSRNLAVATTNPLKNISWE